MKNILNFLFDKLIDVPENLLWKNDLKTENERFYDTYIDIPENTNTNACEEYSEIMYKAQLEAFKLGFRTAVHMFMDKS